VDCYDFVEGLGILDGFGLVDDGFGPMDSFRL
jgi:hypothetical protein